MFLAAYAAQAVARFHFNRLRTFIDRYWSYPRVTVGVRGGVTSPRFDEPAPTWSQVKRARRLARAQAFNREKGLRARIDDMIRYCVRCGTPDQVIRENLERLASS